MSTVHRIRNDKVPTPERDAALRRLALQIAVQLPENADEALRALEHAKTLVRTFLADPRPV